MASRKVSTTLLQWYFGHLYPLEDKLLVASASRLHCFDQQGIAVWQSADLGLDGVIVDSVDDGVIHGQGEWDPPGGWRPFRVALATGA
ncbi:MAG TPA: hypothetical protein VH083_08370, partial [Myxococcales bacterium]|nr:hypothetical protein [Myxococcales bacterium]